MSKEALGKRNDMTSIVHADDLTLEDRNTVYYCIDCKCEMGIRTADGNSVANFVPRHHDERGHRPGCSYASSNNALQSHSSVKVKKDQLDKFLSSLLDGDSIKSNRNSNANIHTSSRGKVRKNTIEHKRGSNITTRSLYYYLKTVSKKELDEFYAVYGSKKMSFMLIDEKSSYNKVNLVYGVKCVELTPLSRSELGQENKDSNYFNTIVSDYDNEMDYNFIVRVPDNEVARDLNELAKNNPNKKIVILGEASGKKVLQNGDILVDVDVKSDRSYFLVNY